MMKDLDVLAFLAAAVIAYGLVVKPIADPVERIALDLFRALMHLLPD